MNSIIFVGITSLLAWLGIAIAVELRDLNREYVQCPRCHLMLEKSKIPVSGYDSEHSSRHLHCPRCGRYISM